MKKLIILLVLLLCSFSILSLSTASSATADSDSWQTKIDPAVQAELKDGATTQFFVTLREQADLSLASAYGTKDAKGLYVYKTLTELATRTQAPLLAQLDANGTPYQSFWITNAVLVTGDSAVASMLAQSNSVASIIPNGRFQVDQPHIDNAAIERTVAGVPSAVEWNIALVNADDVWNLGITGQGVVVAGQDTGYQWDHPALKIQYRGWNGTTANHDYNWHDAITTGTNTICVPNSPAPCDDHNHGTHTMGTMVGDDGAGNQIGMAPGADWIACRNMDVGNGNLGTYSDCFQWFIAPTKIDGTGADPLKAPHVINNSWACTIGEGCNISNFATMEAVVDNVRAAGIFVVASAGNSGSACSTISTPPAMFDSSFTVGSTTSNNIISGFSSRGPVTADGSGLLKPDITAPGSGIRSAVRNGAYQPGWSGTSMAGPHVAGLVALMLDANPFLAGDVPSIELIIRDSALQITTSETCGGVSGTTTPNNTFGYGRIDALQAVQDALDFTPTSVDLQSNSIEQAPTFLPLLIAGLICIGAITIVSLKQARSADRL